MASTILLTTDFSDEAKRAYAPTLELANRYGANIELLHVVPDVQSLPHGAPLAPLQAAPATEENRIAAENSTRQLAQDLGASVTPKVIVATDVAAAITQRAEQIAADFITLSTHGRSGFRRLLLGSVAEKVIRNAMVPVVVFPRTTN